MGSTKAVFLLALVACTPETSAPIGPAGFDPCEIGITPTTIDAAIQQAEALPEPTVRCFLASLERPLQAVAAHSVTSTQRSTVEDPRVFLFLGDDLVVSTIAVGDAAGQLEFGERIDAGHSIKAELVEPFGSEDPFEVVRDGSGTSCGMCHADEIETATPNRFVSKALRPQRDQLVPMGEGALDYLACTESSARCERLEALFGHGAVEETTFGPGYDVLF